MNCYSKGRALVAAVALLLPFKASSNQDIDYQDWVVQVKGDGVEAHTRSGNNASLGFYCKDEVCFFYINFNATCPVGAKNPVLMSSGGVSSAFMATCTKFGKHYFQVLDDPTTVNQAINTSQQIGFSLALQGGDFFVVKFSLNNAKAAIERAISEVKQKKNPINLHPGKLLNI